MTSSRKTVFLSGPMSGIPRAEGLSWRRKAQELLNEKANTLHAYRGREEREPFPCSKAAVVRDKNDISRSDVVIVNDTFTNASMIGTSMEVLYACEANKPVIVFGNAHSGDYWLEYHSTARVETLEEACEIVLNFFL